MEDEDEITHSVEQASMAEPPEQCGTAGNLSESLLTEVNSEEVVAAMVVEREDDAVENVKGGAKMEELIDDGVIMEKETNEAERNEVEVSTLEGVKVEENENGEEGSPKVSVNVDEGLGGGEEAEKKEEEGGEEAEKKEEEGGEDAEKGEVLLGEEGGEDAEKKEEEGGEEAEKKEEEGGEDAEKEEEVVGEEEGRDEETEDSEATGDGEVSPRSPVVAEEEMETESEVVKSGSGSGGKRRRGQISKASTPVKVPARKTVGEDVCFICLDGGDLVLCDRRFVCFSLL